jgi:hypothetical protein
MITQIWRYLPHKFLPHWCQRRRPVPRLSSPTYRTVISRGVTERAVGARCWDNWRGQTNALRKSKTSAAKGLPQAVIHSHKRCAVLAAGSPRVKESRPNLQRTAPRPRPPLQECPRRLRIWCCQLQVLSGCLSPRSSKRSADVCHRSIKGNPTCRPFLSLSARSLASI